MQECVCVYRGKRQRLAGSCNSSRTGIFVRVRVCVGIRVDCVLPIKRHSEF